MRKYGGAIISGNIYFNGSEGFILRHTKLRERLVLVAKKKTGIMDHQRGNVRHSPSVTLYFTHASSSLSLSLPPFRSNFFFSSDQVHTARRTPPTSRGQLFISNSRAGPAKGTRRSAGGKKTMAWAVQQFSRESTKD